ncbi:hypothetical protein GCM10010910_01090 [Microbacterium nanhaiense]|uniref:Gram-positive cocci surface proteins LPxTG domain-containing protein n=1 Tax=Microbacterium nanhaiense TaxID=1301026 RepID=A0ABQ2MUJ4_9MICO|nr:hypothetical protein [Microbacterium nanhaiense]GGO59057.1 hypothetical protein GCM10010910_01090 [Microbacterium nanhaiense]
MKKTLTAAIATALILAPTMAHAGTDPYTVDAAGITINTGPIPDNFHINVRTTANVSYNIHGESKCITRTDAECAGQRHEVAQLIGQTFVPWSIFGIPEGQACAIWIQYSGTNYHFGEAETAGQVAGPDCAAPSDPDDPKTTPTDPPVTPEPTEEPTPEPTPEPTEEPTEEPTPEPTETPEPTTPPGPVEPAGSDMRPLIALGGGGLIAAGLAALLIRRKKAQR